MVTQYEESEKELENKVGDFNEFLKQMNIVVNVKKADSFSSQQILEDLMDDLRKKYLSLI